MTARFICDANYLPCAVELSGRSYTLAEIESIVGAALEYRAAVEESNGIVAAEQRLFTALAGHSPDVGAKVCARPLHKELGAFCEVPGCDEKRTGSSPYCKKHDMRFKRHGDPTVVLHAWDKRKQSK